MSARLDQVCLIVPTDEHRVEYSQIKLQKRANLRER
jgi:hypothetical protein